MEIFYDNDTYKAIRENLGENVEKAFILFKEEIENTYGKCQFITEVDENILGIFILGEALITFCKIVKNEDGSVEIKEF